MSNGMDRAILEHDRDESEEVDSTAPPDDGYWEALLEEGEVTSAGDPPPWVGEEGSLSYASDGKSRASWSDDDWIRANQLSEEGGCCELIVTGFNRCGLLVQFGRLTGFVPCSHLVDVPVFVDAYDRDRSLLSRVGQHLTLQVIEIDRDRDRLILPERAALEDERRDQIFATLRPGDVVTGRVSNLRRFGAFVDLGGYEGLVHISEMSWGRVNHPGDVVQPGDEVQVHVLDVNPEERKIQLSLKQLQPDPWRDLATRYTVGQIVEGEITNVVAFGAFTRLEDGIEGLIHISELAEGNFLHPRNVVREGQSVSVKILSIDPGNRRIGLSLRRAKETYPEYSGADRTSMQAL